MQVRAPESHDDYLEPDYICRPGLHIPSNCSVACVNYQVVVLSCAIGTGVPMGTV